MGTGQINWPWGGFFPPCGKFSFVGVQFKKRSLPLKNSYPPAENLIKPLCSIGCSSEIYWVLTQWILFFKWFNFIYTCICVLYTTTDHSPLGLIYLFNDACCFICFRLFRNLMKEVRMYAQKFIDRGKVFTIYIVFLLLMVLRLI